MLATRALFTGAVPDLPAVITADALTTAPAGGWSWFMEPRALSHEGVTYWGYLDGSDGDVIVTDGTSSFTLHVALEVDDHDAPALVVHDGYLWAFYSKHGTDDDLRWRRTTNALPDISAWTDEATIDMGTSSSYAQAWSDGTTIRVIARDFPTDTAIWKMVASTDGSSWSAPVTVYSDSGRWAYLRTSWDGERLQVAVADGHPAHETDTSILHFTIEGGDPYATDGTALSFPVSRSTATEVYDGSSVRSWVWDVAPGPVIVFATFPSTSDHRYQYATWDGDSWAVEQIAAAGGHIYGNGDEPYYSGGIALDRGDPREVYASIAGDGGWQMWRYIKRASWSSTKLTGNGKNIRPAAIHSPGPFRALWMVGTYSTYVSYSVGTWGATR